MMPPRWRTVTLFPSGTEQPVTVGSQRPGLAECRCGDPKLSFSKAFHDGDFPPLFYKRHTDLKPWRQFYNLQVERSKLHGN